MDIANRASFELSVRCPDGAPQVAPCACGQAAESFASTRSATGGQSLEDGPVTIARRRLGSGDAVVVG
ncbi:hypothetical protein B4N89_36865 [Embleya scabrispora]|uniref:Uncharacterized protein n=1 Tax=Embleya scabrispora TaxID=159449 RepID=A0A1T3NLS6_9ACTN|nr:hypothetical protein [Embleya scabrispora]OPC77843.1 hypothetical protein B4N89_36865 [Embleya scabrispora]